MICLDPCAVTPWLALGCGFRRSWSGLGRRETRSRAAYLMRRHIQFDYEYVMMVTKDPPNQPTRWRPKSRAHFMKRWEKMCTVAHGLLIFNELIRRAEEPPD